MHAYIIHTMYIHTALHCIAKHLHGNFIAFTLHLHCIWITFALDLQYIYLTFTLHLHCFTVRFSTLHITLRCIAVHYSAPNYIISYCIILIRMHFIAFEYFAVYLITLHCINIAMHYISLHYVALPYMAYRHICIHICNLCLYVYIYIQTPITSPLYSHYVVQIVWGETISGLATPSVIELLVCGKVDCCVQETC